MLSINVETEYRVGIRIKHDSEDYQDSNEIRVMSGKQLLEIISRQVSRELYALEFKDNNKIIINTCFEIGSLVIITILDVIPEEIKSKALMRSYDAEVEYLQSLDTYEQCDPAEFAAAREHGRKVYEEAIVELLRAEAEKHSWEPIELADGTLF